VRDKRCSVSAVGLLQIIAILTVVFSFLTGLDIPHRNIELFSHFRLQYLVVSVLLLLVFAFLRNYVYVIPLGVAAIFNAALVLPVYFSDSSAGDMSAGEGSPLKLIHANVLSSNTDYERLLKLVAAEDPDMIFLQEVTAKWVEGTTSLLEDYPYAYTEPRTGNFGIGVFSKIPFDSIGHVDSPPLNYPTILATITIGDERVSMISSHPTIPISGRLYEARNQQLASMAEMVNEASGRVILLGDFNSTIWCAQFRRLEKSTGLKNVRRGFGVIPTWPAYLPFAMIPIDHALVSKSISVSQVRTGKNFGSDHLPLIVTLIL
jgi:endonuclease/exonuclease/phosphatase (EEP) superfamily protein YafD